MTTLQKDQASSRPATLEQHSIDFIPASERYGKPASLFTMWFGNNLIVQGIVAGGISASLGMPFVWTAVSIVAGQVFGALFMALHSAQGPKLGIPQMIQSRAQFGYVGAAVPLAVVLVMYVGYGAVGGVLAGQALASLVHVNTNVCIVFANVLAGVMAVVGYRLLHQVAKTLTVVMGVALLVMTIGLLVKQPLGQLHSHGQFGWGPFLLAMSISAIAQLTYAPYVADYSRYLPADTSARRTFWATYAGTVIALTWMFLFGAIAATVATNAFAGGSLDFLAHTAGFAPTLFLFVLVVGTAASNALNFYGMFMSWTTTMTTFTSPRVTPKARAAVVAGAVALTSVLALAGKANFLTNVLNLTLFLGLILIPWTAINLADFYLVRKERYDIGGIFDARGRYAGIDWRTMAAYVLGVVVELPFMSTSIYTGPLVHRLGGADISWLLGVAVSLASYYLIMTAFPLRRGFRATEDHLELRPAVITLPAAAPVAVPAVL